MTACEQAGAEFAAEILCLGGERGFVGASSEGDLVLRSKRLGSRAMANAGKLEAMQQQASFSCRTRTNLNASLCIRREQVHDPVDSRLAPIERGLR